MRQRSHAATGMAATRLEEEILREEARLAARVVGQRVRWKFDVVRFLTDRNDGAYVDVKHTWRYQDGNFLHEFDYFSVGGLHLRVGKEISPELRAKFPQHDYVIVEGRITGVTLHDGLGVRLGDVKVVDTGRH